MRLKKILSLVFLAGILASLLFTLAIKGGKLWITSPFAFFYPVRGVDVSAHQGLIDWTVLASADIDFAFIKATEGSTFRDRQFSNNWRNAAKTGLRIGAYHFFSFESSGEKQAENFIATVEKIEHMLPPAIDLEFYGEYGKNQPEADPVRENLRALSDRLEAHYGMKPVIYATKSSYEKYVAGFFPDHEIWIRNIRFLPRLSDGRPWTFWQYSNRTKLKGYAGQEEHIDLNFFRGDAESFRRYPEGAAKAKSAQR